MYTLTEAATRLGIRRGTLLTQVRRGLLATQRVRSVYLVTASEVARYDEQRKQPRGFARIIRCTASGARTPAQEGRVAHHLPSRVATARRAASPQVGVSLPRRAAQGGGVWEGAMEMEMDRWLHAQVYVGNADADYLMAGLLQLELLKRNGLKPHHHILDIGCGALVAGRPIMQYLKPDRYVGIEPNLWLVEAARAHFPDMEDLFLTKRPLFLAGADFDAAETGRVFDFVIALGAVARRALAIAAVHRGSCPRARTAWHCPRLDPRFDDADGRLMGDSLHEQWQYPGVSYFAVETVRQVAEEHGLHAEDRPDYREFVTRYLPSLNFHDWIRLRRLAGVGRMERPNALYGIPGADGRESER